MIAVDESTHASDPELQEEMDRRVGSLQELGVLDVELVDDRQRRALEEAVRHDVATGIAGARQVDRPRSRKPLTLEDDHTNDPPAQGRVLARKAG